MKNLSEQQLAKIYQQVAPFTMVCEDGVKFTANSVVELINDQIPGLMIECGTWKGGCSAAMLLAQLEAFGNIERPVHLFDSFAGLPVASLRDGNRALEWQATTQDNCKTSRLEVDEMLRAFGFTNQHYIIWEGWFKDTLHVFRQTVQSPLALLRIDCDWYDSTKYCLDLMFSSLSHHGKVILDDYFAWDGCTRAVHDFLSKNDLPYRLSSLSSNSAAYLVKELR